MPADEPEIEIDDLESRADENRLERGGRISGQSRDCAATDDPEFGPGPQK